MHHPFLQTDDERQCTHASRFSAANNNYHSASFLQSPREFIHSSGKLVFSANCAIRWGMRVVYLPDGIIFRTIGVIYLVGNERRGYSAKVAIPFEKVFKQVELALLSFCHN